MAVEARHLNPFPPPPTQDRDLFNHQPYTATAAHHMHFIGNSFAWALPENQQFYSPAVSDTFPAVKYGAPDSRKRARDQLCATPENLFALQKNNALPLVAAGDSLPQIQQFQMDIDSLIADHSKRIRLELAERQKQQAILLAETIGESLIKKLKDRDDQIQRMGKLNLVLQEKVKSLYVENQLLRDLAQSNEAAANSLRTNLQQVLLHVSVEEPATDAADLAEEVGSCCGSIDAGARDHDGLGFSGDRRCRKCGERESCVLLLPCRHLCLCNVCGSGSRQVSACPVCHSNTTATLHVDLFN